MEDCKWNRRKRNRIRNWETLNLDGWSGWIHRATAWQAKMSFNDLVWAFRKAQRFVSLSCLSEPRLFHSHVGCTSNTPTSCLFCCPVFAHWAASHSSHVEPAALRCRTMFGTGSVRYKKAPLPVSLTSEQHHQPCHVPRTPHSVLKCGACSKTLRCEKASSGHTGDRLGYSPPRVPLFLRTGPTDISPDSPSRQLTIPLAKRRSVRVSFGPRLTR